MLIFGGSYLFGRNSSYNYTEIFGKGVKPNIFEPFYKKWGLTISPLKRLRFLDTFAIVSF